jgi:hypothetical protein
MKKSYFIHNYCETFHMSENPNTVPFLNVSKLAKMAGVSEGGLVMTVTNLGNVYTEFMKKPGGVTANIKSFDGWIT